MNSVPSSIQIRVLFFAKTRELSGHNDAYLELESRELTTAELKDLLCKKFNLQIIKQNIILAINENYLDDPNQLLDLKENDEIALIPPISGG